ncbi:MAG: AI-2E family transporter [Nitrospiraceae bacterium]|nr:MAG: AI-2E family transporter [Nitrospiraceae bacterium]
MPEHDKEPIINEINRIYHQMPRWVIQLLLAGIFIFFAYHTVSLLITLLLSFILAYIVNNLINIAESMGIKRYHAVVMFYVLMLVLLIVAEMILAPYLQKEVEHYYARLPEFSARIENILTNAAGGRISNYPLSDEIIRKMLNTVMRPGIMIDKTLNFSDIVNKTTSLFFGAVLVPFFAFFLLRDWPVILKKVMSWVPPQYVETTVSLLSEINILVGKYLRGLTLDCILVGITATVGLSLFGINYPISLGILTGVANVIPYFGPVMACAAASLIAFTQFNSTIAVLNMIILYIAIRLIDDLAIQHVTLGKIIKLHPMLLVITIMSGYMLFGVIGMVVAVPAVSVIQKVLSIIIENRKHLAGENDSIRPVNFPV